MQLFVTLGKGGKRLSSSLPTAVVLDLVQIMDWLEVGCNICSTSHTLHLHQQLASMPMPTDGAISFSLRSGHFIMRVQVPHIFGLNCIVTCLHTAGVRRMG